MSYNKEYHAYTLSSETQYKNVTSISFTPITELDRDSYDIEKIHSKGDKVVKKILGIKIFERTCEEDEYFMNLRPSFSYINYTLKGTISHIKKEMCENPFVYRNIIWKGLNLYTKARVCVVYEKDIPTNEYFESNEMAEKYLQEIKEKCEKVGNFLS